MCKKYVAKIAGMAAKNAGGPTEGGFVECLFEMWKLIFKINNARAEIIVTGMWSKYTHRFGDFSYQKCVDSIQIIFLADVWCRKKVKN